MNINTNRKAIGLVALVLIAVAIIGTIIYLVNKPNPADAPDTEANLVHNIAVVGSVGTDSLDSAEPEQFISEINLYSPSGELIDSKLLEDISLLGGVSEYGNSVYYSGIMYPFANNEQDIVIEVNRDTLEYNIYSVNEPSAQICDLWVDENYIYTALLDQTLHIIEKASDDDIPDVITSLSLNYSININILIAEYNDTTLCIYPDDNSIDTNDDYYLIDKTSLKVIDTVNTSSILENNAKTSALKEIDGDVYTMVYQNGSLENDKIYRYDSSFIEYEGANSEEIALQLSGERSNILYRLYSEQTGDPVNNLLIEDGGNIVTSSLAEPADFAISKLYLTDDYIYYISNDKIIACELDRSNMTAIEPKRTIPITFNNHSTLFKDFFIQ